MNLHRSKKRRDGVGGPEGAALILTLAALVLMSILVLAFLSKATLGRRIAFSSAGQARAEWLAQTSLETLVGDLRKEILAGSKADNDPTGAVYTSVSGKRIFVPRTNFTVVPQRVGAIVHPNLIKISEAGTSSARVSSWSGSEYLTGNATGIDYIAPMRSLLQNNTTTASRNQRSVAKARWAKSQMLGLTMPTAWRNPDWVIITRKGAVDANPSTGMTPSLADLSNPDPLNGRMAVGRFAFALYNQGGLIDINVAGNRLAASENSRRGRLHQLSLSELKDSGDNALIPDSTAFLAWRNSINGTNASSVPGSWGLFDPLRTFMNVYVSNTGASEQTFVSRKDLIDYAQNNPAIIKPAALEFLSTFNRTRNAPAWLPTVDAPAAGPYNYRSNAESSSASVINRNLATLRFASGGSITATANLASRTVQAGDLVLNKRFPLSRLAWIDRNGPAGGATAADIKRAFGLRFVSRGIWEYTSPDSNSRAVRIKTLNEVAALATPREPDFFELLQAGILNGSLGLSNRANQGTAVFRTNADTRDMDRSKSRQIMQIGVNIIDQYDGDSWPTTLLLDWFNDTAASSPTRLNPAIGSPYTPTSSTVYLQGIYPGIVGVEDVPFVYKIYQTYYRHPALGGGNRVGIFQFVEMWNPHQPAAVSTGGPTKFRIRVESGTSIFTQRSDQSVISGFPLDYSVTPQEIVLDTALDSFRSPKILCSLNSTGPATWARPGSGPVGGNIWFIPGAWHDAFDNQYRFPLSFNSTRPPPTYRLDYQDENGNWSTYPYQLFPEYCRYYDDRGSGASESANWAGAYAVGSYRPDPRGMRWGFSEAGGSWKFNQLVNSGEGSYFARPTYQPPSGATNDNGLLYTSDNVNNPNGVIQFNDWTNWVNGGARFGSFSFNRSGDTRSLDIDGVLRSGDSINGTSPTDVALPSPNPDPRPLVLNRPFRTVAELGYVYRDQPWKTLDLFTANSADAGLQDLFTVHDSEVYAGVVDLNTKQAPVLQAVIAGSIKTEAASSPTLVSPTEAKALAQALVELTTIGGGDGLGPLGNVSELSTRYLPSITNTTVAPWLKTQRESAVRTLAGIGGVRTWNLMIDLFVQSGRYPQDASSLNDFVVEGERHYWFHVAIDRFTGEILGQYLEPVQE